MLFIVDYSLKISLHSILKVTSQPGFVLDEKECLEKIESCEKYF